MPLAEQSLFLPPFLRRLADPSVKSIMLCGCGGGFDFVHSLLLYPELIRLGKSVVIGSYSFGNPNRITGDTVTIFDRAGAVAKRVTGASHPDPLLRARGPCLLNGGLSRGRESGTIEPGLSVLS
jgi:hypothetical protein